MSIFSNSERRQVFFNYGRHDAARGRYVKAPFDLILIGNDWCLITNSGEGQGTENMAAYTGKNALVGADEYDTEAYVMGREEGWHSLTSIVVEPHELGSGAENGWKGCHRFGWI